MEHEQNSAVELTLDGRVYVVRVWRGEPQPGMMAGPAWHATVREGTTGVRRTFGSVDDCIEHLYGELMRR
ncbi:hypothetical protein ACFSC4_27115 [Deinococcus malanensis]|uniref:hypothetical protein n=1 Tax=Deinococcus malanensis TaxID=1706855 RepID=UPI0016639AC9|nr:hypothetical protein [Deinococcus malanensis]